MGRFRFVPLSQVSNCNREIFGELGGCAPAQHGDRFARFWNWSEHNGLHERELLLPQFQRTAEVVPFTWEKELSNAHELLDDIKNLGPWAYQVEFGHGVSTLGDRNPADYDYHRYRANLFVGLVEDVLGWGAREKTVLDVACHCGPIALEFASRGFDKVKGIDLRPENIAQANFLAKAFGVKCVEFHVENARNISKGPHFDIVFCGGLLYHVVFPVELVADLFRICNDFIILDTLAHKDPFSGFHLVCNKDVNYSAEGEFHYEFHPTYRGVIDALQSVGFGENVFEIIGSDWQKVPHYQEGVTRSFIAFKPNSRTLQRLRALGLLNIGV